MPKPNHRDKILFAGLAVFHEQGFHGSGVQDVVNHAGVPKGSFYNHIKSKEALGLEVLKCYWEAGGGARTELQANGASALKRIDRHLAAIGYDKNGCLIGNFSSELDRSDDVVFIRITLNAGRTIEKKKALYAEIAKRLKEDPGVRPEDVVISLLEVAKEDWSLGNGVAQYA